MIEIPASIDTSSLEVEVHVIGPGYGECVVIVIGKRIVIGIDSCFLAMKNTLTEPSYVERLLESVGSDAHVFWLLTHYHFDHFYGLASFLERCGERLRSLIVPLDYLPADLVHLLALDAEKESGSGDAYFQATSEYERLRNILAKGAVSNVESGRSGFGTWFKTDLRSLRDGRRVAVCATLDCIRPSKLASFLGGSMSEVAKNPMSAKKNRKLGNEGSYVLHLGVGKFSGVFLGDAPAKRTKEVNWKDLLKGGGDLLLKVAHHGAKDGTSEDLLLVLGSIKDGESRKARKALIAPFAAHGLPRKTVIELLNGSGFDVRIAGGKRKKSGQKKREIETLTRTLVEGQVQSVQEAGEAFIVERFYT